MTKHEYRQKLRDPRWQKKRLEILNRDGFSCCKCRTSKETLHVHHKRYIGGDPWNIPNDALVTLCEGFHANETEMLSEACAEFLAIVRDRFTSDEIYRLAASLLENCDVADYGSRYLPDDPRMWLIKSNKNKAA